MKRALELYESRVSEVYREGDAVRVVLSHAYIHQSRGRPGQDSGTGWSQRAEIVLHEGSVLGPSPPLPNTIAEGFLESGAIRHELIPLPFARRGEALLNLIFEDGSSLTVNGRLPAVEMLSSPIYLEDFP